MCQFSSCGVFTPPFTKLFDLASTSWQLISGTCNWSVPGPQPVLQDLVWKVGVLVGGGRHYREGSDCSKDCLVRQQACTVAWQLRQQTRPVCSASKLSAGPRARCSASSAGWRPGWQPVSSCTAGSCAEPALRCFAIHNVRVPGKMVQTAQPSGEQECAQQAAGPAA